MQQQKPLVHKAWLRVLIFCTCYVMMIMVAAMLMGALAKHIATDFMQFSVGILLSGSGSLLLYAFFRKYFDRSPFTAWGFTWKGFGAERKEGILSAVAILSVIALALWVGGYIRWYANDWQGFEFILVFLLMLWVALAEETVFRGYILANLMESVPKETALLIAALLFALFHSLNPDFSLIGFVNIFLAGILLGINFLFSRNLWFALSFHFMWNFFQGPLLGFDVSGIALPSLLVLDVNGPALLTGGKFGLEASLLTTLFLTVASVALYNAYRKRYAPTTGL